MSNAEKDVIICRCQDITLEQVKSALEKGITDPEELKRFLHIGMGPCQGRTCGRLVLRLISQATGQPVTELSSTHQRPPLISVPIRDFLGNDE